VKRTFTSKIFVFLVISLFVVTSFPQTEVPISSAQPTDNWIAHPLFESKLSYPLTSPQGYYPNQIRTAYGLPSSGGAGCTIAIIDAYASPTIQTDLTTFSTYFGLPAANLEVYPISLGIGYDSGWAQETCLDVEWAHAIAPDAKILLVEAVNPERNSMLAAIDYARTRSDVVAISMSWGGDEPTSWGYYNYAYYDSKLTSNYGAAFFAAAGDNGSQMLWPASSTNVVAVGGTTLNLNADGRVISESAWNGSGGGVSLYEPRPDYQTNFGLTTSKRAIPDVSYNANPNTGVAVYCNSQWYIIGGTSAGSPQWAAIYALDRSATNANLYAKAKLAYSSYFRDITSGSNGYNAAIGYDFVTGLGSPLTYNFGTDLNIYPSSGPAGGEITLNGVGFSTNSSTNISWLNPLTSTWTTIANNVTTDYTGNFTYMFNAPDLLQNNLPGDNQPSFNNIFLRAQDNSCGKSYNSTIPYSEIRRGLVQINNQSAIGIYGNSTDLSATVFVQTNQSVIVEGNYFNPNITGVASLFWDVTRSIGSAAIDATGHFNTTFQVPISTAGKHTITINDGAANFCVNITRFPAITNNYTSGWHTTDTTINLTSDSIVNETFYKINNGQTFNVTANGQPAITTEGNNNTLEYWSTWNLYGNITKELPHETILGIQLQKTPPAGSIQINNGATSTSETSVTLSVIANDSLSGFSHVRFSNDGVWDQVPWAQYNSTTTWELTSGEGTKTVYCQVIDNAGLTAIFNTSIALNTPLPLQTISPASTSNPSSSPSNSPSPTISATLSQSPSLISTPTTEPTKTPTVPEFGYQIIVVLLALLTLSLAIVYKKHTH
jgi:hypothetical protein